VVVAVTNGRLDFGTWERIFQGQAGWLAREFDGRRRKRVLVKIIGGRRAQSHREHNHLWL
jgi:thiamine phosphate synthase YjbQ (UPF0047 family)